MFKTEKEIFSQYDALKKSYGYLAERKDELTAFIGENDFDSITFIGCGSSYSLCKSASLSAGLRCGKKTYAFAAGDIMINFPFYEKILANTLVVAPSRSGSTSEAVNAVRALKEKAGAKCISIAAVAGSELSRTSDFSLELPWAFDESVCQTRTVTNLYTADLFLAGVLGSDEKLLQEILDVINAGEDYMEANRAALAEIAAKPWQNAVVLADGELEGIAEEGALAFKEICQRKSSYHHILDVRHGPAVLIDSETLVIAATTPYGLNYQKDLLAELAAKGAFIVTVGSKTEGAVIPGHHVVVPESENYSVRGIPFIFVPQVLTLGKALSSGINPDLPSGLNPWIKL